MIVPILLISFALSPGLIERPSDPPTESPVVWSASSASGVHLSWRPDGQDNQQEAILTCVRPPDGHYTITVHPENLSASSSASALNAPVICKAETVSDVVLRHHRLITLKLTARTADESVLAQFPRIDVQIEFDDPSASSASGAHHSRRIQDNPGFDAILNALVVNPGDLSRWRIPSLNADLLPVQQNSSDPTRQQLSGTPGKTDAESIWLKAAVSQDGLYSIPLLPEFAGIDPRTVRLFNRGHEVPIRVLGEEDGSSDPGDRLEFIGKPNRQTDGSEDPYTDTNIYRITYGGEPGVRSAIFDAAPGTGTAAVAYREYARIEQNEAFFGNDFYWMGVYAGQHEDFVIPADALDSSGQDPILRLRLRGGSATDANPDHHVRVRINGQLIHDGFFDGYDVYEQEIAFPRALMQNGSNVVRLECPGDTGAGSVDVVWVDWFEIEYQRQYVAASHAWFIRSPAPFLPGFIDYTITGFDEPVTRLYRVSDYSEFQDFTVEADLLNGTFTLRFSKEEHFPQTYLAVTQSGLSTPDITVDTPSDWKSPDHGADVMIISHRDFVAAIATLAELRRSQGYRVQVIDVEDIYDEFNDGIFSPEAITAFCRYAFFNWQPPAPAAVLLVGDACWDYKHYLPGTVKQNFVPSYTKQYFQTRSRNVPALDETISGSPEHAFADWDFIYGSPMVDDQFVCIAGDDNIPDMMIGRFSVESAEEAAIMVEKTIQYESQSRDKPWQKTLTYITGGFDDAEQDLFSLQADTLIDTFVHPSGAYWRPDRIYKTTDDPWFGFYEEDIRTAIDTGTAIVSFFGHAGSWSWEAMFDFNDIADLNNASRLPFIASMTCNTARFANPEIDSFGEAFVNTGDPDKGAVAFWGGCTFGGLWTDYYLSYFWHDMLFNHRLKTAGQSILAAKALALMRYPSYAVILEPYTYLGDPNLRLGLPSFPTILLSGFSHTSVSTYTGGEIHILAFVTHTDGPGLIDHVELLINGQSTGVYLLDDGLNGDFGSGDGVFGLKIPAPSGIQAGQYTLSLLAVDIEGNTSVMWPSLVSDQ